MMHGARHSSRSQRALGLRKVTLLVPEHRAEALRQLARELCAQHRGPTASAIPQWRKLSPSAELLVDPGCGARCAVRDTRATGRDRYQWSMSMFGEAQPVAEGRAEDREEAQFLATQALRAYAADLHELGSGQDGDG